MSINRGQSREREIALLRGLSQGKTVKMVAREVGIHPDTMKKYSDRARVRLGAETLTQAVFKAREMGLI